MTKADLVNDAAGLAPRRCVDHPLSELSVAADAVPLVRMPASRTHELLRWDFRERLALVSLVQSETASVPL